MSNNNNVITSEFKLLLKQYIDYDNQIKQSSEAIRIIKKKRDELKTQIYKYMKYYEMDEIKMSDSKIKTYISKSTAPLNKAWIHLRCLAIFNGNEEKALKVFNFIIDPTVRPKKEKHSIKRLKNRKKKN